MVQFRRMISNMEHIEVVSLHIPLISPSESELTDGVCCDMCACRKPIGSQVIKKKFPPTLPPK